MNVLQILFQQPWMERLGWTLVHFLWQGALIAALFACIRRALGATIGPPARYLLACFALAALIAAPVVTFGLTAGAAPLSVGAHFSGRVVDGGGVVSDAAAAASWRMAAAGGWRQALPWMVMLWVAGAIAFSLRLIGGWAMAMRMRSASTRPSPPEWQTAVNRLAVRIGVSRPQRLLLSPKVEAPVVVGWLRPVILIPAGALMGMPWEHIEALLAHELAHIRRHDYLANLLQSVAEALLFYHPAVWWISGQIRAERELCCDDIAVAATGDVLTYARALAEMESCRPAHPRAAVAANGGSLLHRIGRLLSPSQPVSHTPSGAAGIALSVLLLAGIGTMAIRGAQTPQPKAGAVTVDLSGAGVMHRTPVAYPALAIDRGVHGRVTAEVTLDAAGDVSDARILSGPAELRRVVLESVLQWHFRPGATGVTRQVAVTFDLTGRSEAVETQARNAQTTVQNDADLNVAEVQRTKNALEKIDAMLRQVNGAAAEPAAELTVDRQSREERTEELQKRLETLLTRYREQLMQMQLEALQESEAKQAGVVVESDPETLLKRLAALQTRYSENYPDVVRLRKQLADFQEHEAEQRVSELQESSVRHLTAQIDSLKKQLPAADPQAQGSIRNMIIALEQQILAIQGGIDRPREILGRALTTIEIRGMSDDAGDDLLSRLPVKEGDRLSADSIAATRRTVREYDEHLECGFYTYNGQVVLQIHPAGAAHEPLIHRK